MPDILTPAPAETTLTPDVATTSPQDPGTPIQGNPAADEARRQLYEKHYGAPPPEDRTEPATTPEPAQGTATPVTPAPTPGAVPPEYMAVLQALQNELIQNREQLTALKNMVRPAEQLRPSGDAYEPEPTWVSLLREGRIKEAEDAMAAAVSAKVTAPAVEQAVSRAREIARAEHDIELFVNDLKTANPELVSAGMEPFVTAEAQARLARVQASGVIKSTDDAVREYKKAVIDATESARNIALKLRGQGATDAMVRSS